MINTEIEILGSRDLKEKILTQIGIEKFYPGLVKKKLTDTALLATAVSEFDKNLSIIGSKESNIIRIKFRHENPKLTAETVNQLVELFHEKHLTTFRNPKTVSFLEGMAAKFSNLLSETEKKTEIFKKEHGAFSNEKQEDVLLHHRGDFDRLLKETQSEAIGLRERLQSLQEQMKTMSETAPLFEEKTERDRSLGQTCLAETAEPEIPTR